MNTLFDVKSTVRSLVGDEAAEWTKDGYLVPKINFAYRTQTLYIKRATGTNLEQIVEIPDAVDGNGNSTSLGRSSLAELAQPGKPLFGLYEPLYLWWKPAGAPQGWYRLMNYEQPLPFNGGGNGVGAQRGGRNAWTWRSNTIFMTPLGFPVDILVDGRFQPPPLVKDTDVLVVHPDMESAITPATLGLIGVEAGNAGYQQAAVDMVQSAADDIVALLIMDKQGRTARAGSMKNRAGMRGWFWF